MQYLFNLFKRPFLAGKYVKIRFIFVVVFHEQLVFVVLKNVGYVTFSNRYFTPKQKYLDFWIVVAVFFFLKTFRSVLNSKLPSNQLQKFDIVLL